MRILGIDFGTSRIKVAYWDEERREAVLLPLGKGGRLYVPSLFHVAKDGRIRFGDEAELMLHHDPLGVLENLKLKLDKPIQYGSNGVTAKSAELMSLLFGRLVDYASREAKPFDGQAPEKLVLTLPSRWDYGDIYRDALAAAGYNGEIVFLREPEAAAWAWIAESESAAGDLLVVLDFGGGTVDWATVQVDERGRPAMIPELPPGGITAAGAHVDEGLFDAMMNRLGDEQRKYALQHRSLLMEQIRQMKESQNGRSSLSGDGGEIMEIMLGPDMFRFERPVFEQVVKREAVDQVLEGVGGYVKKVIRYAKGFGKTEITCVLVGGTRMLAGLEEQVNATVQEIGKAEEAQVRFASLGQADFATVRGAVRSGRPSRPVHIEVNEPQEQRQPSPKLPENFVLIKGGIFMMGSPETEAERKENESQIKIQVNDFVMCKYSVTVAEFRQFVIESGYITGAERQNWSMVYDGNDWKSKSGVNWRYEVYEVIHSLENEKKPVIHVSWNDAVAYCQWLSEHRDGTYRLPTEVEWEYACRAGTSTPFNTGINLTTEQANYNGEKSYDHAQIGIYRKKVVPVDSYKPNNWGLYNMHGNVWEWCEYREEIHAFGQDDRGIINKYKNRIYQPFRGGSWSSNAGRCRCAYRGYGAIDDCSDCIGFRVVVGL